jgi:hypothetical protein
VDTTLPASATVHRKVLDTRWSGVGQQWWLRSLGSICLSEEGSARIDASALTSEDDVRTGRQERKLAAGDHRARLEDIGQGSRRDLKSQAPLAGVDMVKVRDEHDAS